MNTYKKHPAGLLLTGILMLVLSPELTSQTLSLKQALTGKFYIGTALNTAQIEEKDTAAVRLIKTHFNAIVAENCMKSSQIQPREGVFNFALPDRFVDFGMKNNMFITGHTLIWHSQAPAWFFTDAEGRDVTREVLIERMRIHISTVVGHYKGKVRGWDVVNEAIDDNGTWRNNKFYQIIGEDYVRLAFQFAREADPQAELYYNDYSLANPVKRRGVIAMIQKLQQQGIKVDAVGEQGHVGLDYPGIGEFEQMILDLKALGVKVMITEMDISVLPMDWSLGADVSARMEYKKKSDLYTAGLPDSVYTAFEKRYLGFFRLFLQHQDVITRVTLWGVHDGQSWKNNWPIPGRTDYPLLFDRKYQAKPVVEKIMSLIQSN